MKEELRSDTGLPERSAKEDRREPQKRVSSQKWVSGEVRRPPGTFRAFSASACAIGCMQMCSRCPPSSRKSAHVGAVLFQTASYPVEAPASKTAQEKSEGKFDEGIQRRLEYKSRLAACRRALRFPPSVRFREADLAFARSRNAPTFQTNAPASASEGVHFASLGDNYSRDHLFPGMRYGNKRSRWRK